MAELTIKIGKEIAPDRLAKLDQSKVAQGKRPDFDRETEGQMYLRHITCFNCWSVNEVWSNESWDVYTCWNCGVYIGV